MKKLIDLKNVSKSYRNGDQELQVLKNVHLEVEEGEFVAIMGPSGSGISLVCWIAQRVANITWKVKKLPSSVRKS